MRRARDVIGLSVYCSNTGKEMGIVHDVLINEDLKIVGFLLDQAGWMKRGRYIPSDSVYSIGEDCVMIPDETAISSFERHVPWNGLYTGRVKLKGKPVIKMNGQQLGQLEDVYFREEMGTIIGYELSDGFLSDIAYGRKTLRKPDHVTLGKDALIVH